jgi:hypothetical protein
MFYAWQSRLANKTTQGLEQEAAEFSLLGESRRKGWWREVDDQELEN